MQTKRLCVLILRVRLARCETGLSPPLTVQRWCFFCGPFMLYLSCFVMLSCASVH